MGIRIARLFAEIGADQSGLDAGLGQAETKLKQFGQADLIKGGLILGALHKIGRGFVDMGRQAVGSYADFELAGMSLQTLVAQELTATGAARDMGEALGMAGEQARGLQDWIQQLAIKSPFTQTGIRAAFQTALAYGMTTKEAQRLSKAVLDFSAGSGRGEAAMNQVALALGQIQAKGRLAGQEVLQLVNAGIGVDNILAKAFGKTTEEIVNLREKGLIPADLAVQAIVESLEKDFGGAAERAGGSFSGLLSSMKDLKEIGLREFFGATFREIQPMLQDFVSALQDPRTLEKITKAGEDLASTFRGMLELAEKAGQTWDSVDESNKRLLTGLGLTVLLGPKVINFMIGFVGLLSKAAVGVKAWQAGMTLTAALGAAGLSSVAIAAGAVAAALASVVAVGWQWNQQIVKTNRAGKEMVGGAWSNFFEEQITSGKNASEVLKEYQATQERVQKQFHEMARGNFASIFVRRSALEADPQALNRALAITAKTFEEYSRVAAEAGLQTELFTLKQWEAIQAQVEAQKMIFGTEKGMQAYSDRWSALAASFGSVNEASYLTSSQLFSLQEEASGYLGSLDQMIQKQADLRSAMEDWNSRTGNDFASLLDQRLTPGTERWLQGMGTIDEVFGTSIIKQFELKKKMEELAQEFANTGDQETFKQKLLEVQEEGLMTMQSELDEVTTKAQELYDKLLAFPSEIRIAIGFDIENYPGFLDIYSKRKQKGFESFQLDSTTPQTRATGGTAWAGRVYRWWERGPEFFVPAQNGRIEPAKPADERPVQVIVQAEVKNDIDIYKMARMVATEIRRGKL
ncbi:MAG: tape measure protein [Anaerolineales bacterium]|nr:tape measure protein [Anaerolineales bacterium]